MEPAEVIVKLDTHPGRAFGYELADDANRPRREGMLSLLRDALVHGLTVTLDYDQLLNNANSRIVRVTVEPVTRQIVVRDKLVPILDLVK